MQLKITTSKHISELYRYLRVSDLIELKAAAGFVAECLITDSVQKSVWVKTAVSEKGQTMAIGGLVPLPDQSKKAAVWMLGTSLVAKHKAAFAFLPQEVIKAAQELGFREIFNYVLEQNSISLRWLEKNGFTIGNKIKFGAEQKKFYYVFKRI